MRGEGAISKRRGMPAVSEAGQRALDSYASALRSGADMRPATLRNYLSDLRQFVAWCEETWGDGQDTGAIFAPTAVTTPLLTRYRTHLQQTLRLRPASVNRALVSLKRYFAWTTTEGMTARNPAAVVKLVGSEPTAPRQLSDKEEEALVATVTAMGSSRDRTMIVLMLHTGLRAGEICALHRADITIGQRSGLVRVTGKRNKYREVPLNATARRVLQEYLLTDAPNGPYLFPSEKTGGALTERAVGYIVRRYATVARLVGVSPHDLRHRFGYRMAESVPLHRLAQIMGHDSLDTTMTYVRATAGDLQREVEKIAWA
jgi:integrase/recombinase XerD